MDQLTRFLQRWRVRLGHLFIAALLVVAAPSLFSAAVGTALAIAGLTMRVLSAGYIEKDASLQRGGPYAHVRNPLYVGSFVMYLGFCVVANQIIFTAIYLPLFFLVYYATIVREEEFLAEKFGLEYQEYAQRVPRFFPRLLPAASGGAGGFEWRQAWRNREYEGMIGAAAVLGMLWAGAMCNFSLLRYIIK